MTQSPKYMVANVLNPHFMGENSTESFVCALKML